MNIYLVQFSFRSNHSSSEAVLTVLSGIFKGLEVKKQSVTYLVLLTCQRPLTLWTIRIKLVSFAFINLNPNNQKIRFKTQKGFSNVTCVTEHNFSYNLNKKNWCVHEISPSTCWLRRAVQPRSIMHLLMKGAYLHRLKNLILLQN